MGILLSLVLGILAGLAAKAVFKLTRSSQEVMALGAIGGVLCGFMGDVMTNGSRMIDVAAVNSIGAAMFGAVLFILLRRLLVEMR